MLPVAPSIAVTASSVVFAPTSKWSTFLPFITTIFVEASAISLASSAWSFLFAETLSFTVISLASINLEALVQLVQPLRS